MELQTALEIKKALELFENELDVPHQTLASLVNFHSKSSFEKLKEASDLWNAFQDADIKQRAVMLGFTLTTNENIQ